MTLYNDLENACSAIKHTPESVDLDHIRVLLRRCQELCAGVDDLIPTETEIDVKMNIRSLANVIDVLQGDNW